MRGSDETAKPPWFHTSGAHFRGATRVYGYGQRQRATGGGGVPSCIVAQLNCNARLRYHRQATFWKYAGKVQLKIHLQRCAMYVECALPVVCALSTVWSHYTHSHDTHDAVDA